MCSSIPQIVLEQIGEGLVYQLALDKYRNFNALFKKYGACHGIFNSACLLSQSDIDRLDDNIKDFMSFFAV